MTINGALPQEMYLRKNVSSVCGSKVDFLCDCPKCGQRGAGCRISGSLLKIDCRRCERFEWFPAEHDEHDHVPDDHDEIGEHDHDEIVQQPVQPWESFPTWTMPGQAVRLIRDAATSIGCDEAMIAVPVLAALAAAVGRSRYLTVKAGWSVPPVLWLALVAESGSSKTPAQQTALKPIRDRARDMIQDGAELQEQYELELESWKSSKGELDKPQPPKLLRLTAGDTTVEAIAPILKDNPRGLLIDRDELASWLGSFDKYSGSKGSDVGSWLSMHSGEGFTVDRKTGQRTIHVPAAAVSLIGGVQPAILREHLKGPHSQNGLSARLLLVAPPREQKRWTDSEIPETTTSGYSDLLDRLLSLSMVDGDRGPQPLFLGLTRAAKDLYRKFYDQHNAEAFQHVGERAAAFAKLEELPLRLALILHACQFGDDRPIGGEIMESAITLGRWFTNEAIRVRGILAGRPTEDLRLVEWVTSKGGAVTAREVQQGCRWIETADQAEAALSALVNVGRGRWDDRPPGNTGGRPTRQFRLVLSTEPH